MSIRIAINGYGRIGRNIVRAFFEHHKYQDIEIVAINDLAAIETSAHLTKYDSAHGRFQKTVTCQPGQLTIDGKAIQYISERDPSKLPWKNLNIDVVCECSGLFTSREKAGLHLTAGAKKVLISAPAGEDVDRTIVYGVNHHLIRASDTIISNASCTTNCLAPLVQPLHQAFGVEQGLMTTVHAYTNDQSLVDSGHSDLRRARAAAQSIIPSKTGAAAAVGLVLPELAGKLDGLAVRVPVINVSLVDLTFTAQRPVTVKSVNDVLKKAAENELAGVLQYNEEPLVSVDFSHNPASSVFDSTQTRVINSLVKVLAWYDNEWGFSNRMLDTAHAMMRASA